MDFPSNLKVLPSQCDSRASREYLVGNIKTAICPLSIIIYRVYIYFIDLYSSTGSELGIIAKYTLDEHNAHEHIFDNSE